MVLLEVWIDASSPATLAGRIAAARAAGFDGVELRGAGPAPGVIQLRAELPVSSLAVRHAGDAAAPGPVSIVEAAASGQTVVLELTAATDRDPGAGLRAGYGGVLHAVFERLRELGPHAEAAGVRVALDPGAAGYLHSPIEAAELIDRVNSPAVGVSVCAGRMAGAATVGDWIEQCAGRLFSLRFSAAFPAQPEWVAALRRLRYNGVLVWRGEANAAAAKQLRRCLHEV